MVKETNYRMGLRSARAMKSRRRLRVRGGRGLQGNWEKRAAWKRIRAKSEREQPVRDYSMPFGLLELFR